MGMNPLRANGTAGRVQVRLAGGVVALGLVAAVIAAAPAAAGGGDGGGTAWGCGHEQMADWYDRHDISYDTVEKKGRRYVVTTEEMHRRAAEVKGVEYTPKDKAAKKPVGPEERMAWYDKHGIEYDTIEKNGRTYPVETEQMHRRAAEAKGVKYTPKDSMDKADCGK